MTLDDLKNELVAVLGFGLEGQSVASYLSKHKIKPVIFDHKPWEEWEPEKKQAVETLGLNIITGPDCLLELGGFKVAFRSPGISYLHPHLQKWVGEGLMLTSQTNWFFEHCPSKIIGVTGTKGKGTTSSLVFEILKNEMASKNISGKVFLTGNIGKAQPFDFLDLLTHGDWVIFELSSFQLQDAKTSPYIAVVLMTTSDHMDYHLDEEEYHMAKSNITAYQKPDDFAVVNQDFPASVKIGEKSKAQKFFFSRKTKVSHGCYALGDEVWGEGLPGLNSPKKLLTTAELLLRGRHNLENVCAAVCASALAGARIETIKKIVKTFRGLEHRLQLIAELEGVKFYDDSISTTPETAIVATESFTEPIILILGGSSKKSDFTEMSKKIATSNNIKFVILMGQEAGRIKEALKNSGFGLEFILQASTMSEVVLNAKLKAREGDVVLLSPACASFGMFKDYADRGEQFKKEVLKQK